MQERFDAEEVARFEKETWSRCARGYTDGFGALVAEGIGPLLDAARVHGGERVLDVGTGPGLVAAAAAERGADPIGLDFSEAMLAEARRLHPELEFHAGSAEALPFDDGEFDAVVGNFVLHHTARPEKVLEEAFRTLRPGGRAAFTVWAALPKLEAFGLFFAAAAEHAEASDRPHGPLFGVSDFAVFRAMARDAGFDTCSVRELPLAWRTPTIDSLLAAFHDWANLEAMPAHVRKAIDRAVRKGADDYRRGDAFALPNPAILVSAVK